MVLSTREPHEGVRWPPLFIETCDDVPDHLQGVEDSDKRSKLSMPVGIHRIYESLFAAIDSCVAGRSPGIPNPT